MTKDELKCEPKYKVGDCVLYFQRKHEKGVEFEDYGSGPIHRWSIDIVVFAHFDVTLPHTVYGEEPDMWLYNMKNGDTVAETRIVKRL